MNRVFCTACICFVTMVSAQTASIADTIASSEGKAVESKASKASINRSAQSAELFDDGGAAANKRVHLHPSITEQIDQARTGLGGVPSGHYVMPGAAFGF